MTFEFEIDERCYRKKTLYLCMNSIGGQETEKRYGPHISKSIVFETVSCALKPNFIKLNLVFDFF